MIVFLCCILYLLDPKVKQKKRKNIYTCDTKFKCIKQSKKTLGNLKKKSIILLFA